MADSSWDTYTPERRSFGRLGGRLLTALAVVAAAITLLVVALVSVARDRHSHAWTLAQRVEAHLRDDDRARELFRRNPVLARSYADEEAFLAQVREHRAGLGLPGAEPPEGTEYQVGTGPFQLWVEFKCTGGTWIRALHGYGGPLQTTETGDGLVRLVLGRDRTDLRQQARKLAAHRASEPWRRFIALSRQLAREGGAETLLRDHPGLRTDPAEPLAFAALARRRRQALLAVPEDPDAKGPFRTRRHSGPFGSRAEISGELPEGGSLRALWRNDRLAEIELH